jgi:macrodomain Ter protein organizer (MatP/YcbG family)
MKKRKNIDLEQSVIKDLQKLADKENNKLKPYIEKVLIDHSKKK